MIETGPENFEDVKCVNLNWEDVNEKNFDSKLSFLSVNVRSICNKFSELEAIIENLKHKYTFILITETWLKEDTDVFYDLQGYKAISLYRSGRVGGGLKLYYQDNLNVTIIDDFTICTENYEVLLAKAHVPGCGHFKICGIYRPPSGSIPDFLNNITEVLDYVCDSKTIIFGDINLDLMQQNNSSVRDYYDLFASYGMTSMVDKPTYVSPMTNIPSSALDHIWHNIPIESSSYTLSPGIADHLAVCCIFEVPNKPTLKKVKFRDFSQSKITKFRENIEIEFENFRPPLNSIDAYANYLSNFLIYIQNKYFPVKTKQISNKRFSSPWITKDIRRCINKKHEWYRLAKQCKITYDSYKNYASDLSYLLRIAKEDYYVYKLNTLNKDNKKSWKTINNMLGRTKKQIPQYFIINGNKITDGEEISREFSDHFSKVPHRIHNSMDTPTIDFSELIPIHDTKPNFTQATERETENAINSLNKEGSITDISRRFLKVCCTQASRYLCQLFNLCIERNSYPKIFKISHVNPIHKKNDIHQIVNYRPISILCNLAKIFEALIQSRIKNLMQHELSENQFGYRKGKCTETAVLTLINRVLPAIENKKFAVCIFLDFSSCFDTISRPLLSQKVHRYGFDTPEVEFINSYFSERKEIIFHNGHYSQVREQELGVVQGSKNGPLFFDIYANDIKFLCSDDEYLMYADDTCLIYQDEDLHRLMNYVNGRIETIKQWCNFNKLSLNSTKSEYMIITNRHITIPRDTIRINNEAIRQSSSVKYLGVHLDSKLRFNDQINHVTSKISRISGISFRLKRFFNLGAAKRFYYAFFYSNVTYCLAIWGGILQCTQKCNRLIHLQEKIVENLFRKNTPINASPFKKHRILKIKDVHRLYVAMYMYRMLYMDAHQDLLNSIDLRTTNHDHNTRSQQPYTLPFPRVDAVRYSYKYQFVKIWNVIPQHLKEINRISEFKRKLIDYFIEDY